MEEWKKIALMTASFAFVQQIRPLDPFLSEYLTGADVNVTLNEVADELVPIQIHLQIFGMALCFLFADYLLYKPVLIFNGVLGILMYVNFINSPSRYQLWMAMSCLSLYGCLATQCYCYAYAKIRDKRHYQMATSYVKSGWMLGMFVSGLVGQLVVMLDHGRCTVLPYLGLFSVTLASALAWLLPPVQHSNFLHNVLEKPIDPVSVKTALFDDIIDKPKCYYAVDEQSKKKQHQSSTLVNVIKCLCEDFKVSYSDQAIRKWSIWYMSAFALHMQINLNISVLFTYNENQTGNNVLQLNGLVSSLMTLSAAFSIYKIGKVKYDWGSCSNTFLGLGSIVLGVLLILCSFVRQNVYVYIMYICYNVLFETMNVILHSQIAENIKNDCFSLVMGFNGFIATCLCAFCTVVSVNMYSITIPHQYFFYGGMFVLLAVMYLWNYLYDSWKTVMPKKTGRDTSYNNME
ncbi:thiamine transporter 1-like [Adelges cooleyi]|uniref:thiamine transporter 1-like n=1 Tax=Adelges cooleyi TaxID=133065 RepID=UPI00217FA390|nr:thiamine transporter 1-like [Adelges cooleyi]